MTHPGIVVREQCITPNRLTVTEPARILGMDRQTLSNLLNARSGISPEMAVKLEKTFGTPARVLAERQLDFEYAEITGRAGSNDVRPLVASIGKTKRM